MGTKVILGAVVQYCGHNGSFVADIYIVEGVTATVVANGPVTPENLLRNDSCVATHHLTSSPDTGCWKPNRGFFSVPVTQLSDLAFKQEPKKLLCHHIWVQEKPTEISPAQDLKILYHRCPRCGKLKITRRKFNQKAPKQVTT